MFTLIFLALPAGLSLPNASCAAPSSAAQEVATRLGSSRSFALLIGISRFENFSDLPWIEEEIRRARISLANAGFDVVEPPYAGAFGRVTAAEMSRWIREFGARHGEDDRLVIYIATHGFASTIRGATGPGYLIGSDTQKLGAGFEATAYSVDQLKIDLSAFRARHLFLVINACFSGSFAKRQEIVRPGATEEWAVEREDPHNSWILGLLRKRAWLVLTAGSDTQTVPDANSPFGLAVSEGLLGAADGNGDGVILGSELASYVRGIVGPRTHALGKPNDPFFASLLPAGEDSPDRDFVFASPIGAGRSSDARPSEDAVTAERNRSLDRASSFTECADCPIMVELSAADQPATGKKVAFARTETTYLEWNACYRQLGCSRYIADVEAGRGNHPVGGLTWLDALEFTTWLNGKKGDKCKEYRIPSPSEWRLAAVGKANSGWRYPWGEHYLADRAACSGCGPRDTGRTMPVASFLPNAAGLYDMAGNVWEWTNDVAVEVCDRSAFLSGERQCGPAPVMGGSYATRADRLDVRRLPMALLPRTGWSAGGNDPQGFSLETVGLRVACDLK